MFELFIARRYLRAKRKQVVISVITAISVIGVAAGVMALVIALAIENGFSSTLQNNLLGATGHVMILDKTAGDGIDGWEQTAAKLKQIPHVKSVTPGLYEGGYLSGAVRGDGIVVKGISIGAGFPLPQALTHLKTGSVGAVGSEGGVPGILLGVRLAERIGAVIGKQVTLIVPSGAIGPFGQTPTFFHLRVAGIFESGFFDMDNSWGYMELHDAQRVFDLTDVVNSIELWLDDVYLAPKVAKEADAVIGPNLSASTWEEQNRQLFDALKMERLVTIVTIGLIEMVAALNILITLVMMVMEKHRDIGILMSMGARTAQIRKIFVAEGVLIGALGTAIGLTFGYSLSYFANHYRLLRLDEAVYSLSYVPFLLRWTDGLYIAAAAMTVSVVATLYPARSAARIAPVEALRYE